MKTRNKKGFTIVELVIVIAVIGILTAILVPVFINLTNKANEASDNSLVKNLNTALRMEEQTAGHKKAPTLQGAIDDLENQGYLLENLQSKSGLDLLWDQEDNQFLLNKDGVAGAKYWKIVDTLPELDQQVYSYYAGQHFDSDTAVNIKYGFDAGDNEDISSVSYINETTEARNVSIRTNGGTLNINAPLDVVKQYGDADSVKVEAIKTSSLHVYGTIKYAEISVGRIAMESGSKINHIHVNAKETTAEKPTEFDEVIIAKDQSVDMPKLSRDDVEIAATGTLVVALQEGTEEVTESTELDYVWLTKQGIYEQIKVSDSNETAGDVWADDEGNSKETQEAAKQIANNFISETVRPTWSSTDTTRELANIENKVEVATAVAQEEAGEAWSTMTEEQKVAAVNEKEAVIVDAEQAVEAQPDKADVETGAVLFAGGTGSQKDPFLIVDYDTFQHVTTLSWTYYAYESYYGAEHNGDWDYACNYADSFDTISDAYFKVKDGISSIDCKNWIPVFLDGNFDGNGVILNNLDKGLFDTVDGESSTIRNFTVNANISRSGGVGAVVYDSNTLNLTIDSVDVHGTIIGASWVTPYVEFGPGPSNAWNLTIKNSVSDATLVATSGVASGFVGHPYDDVSNGSVNGSSLITIIDSAYIGNMTATGSATGTNFKYFTINGNDNRIKTYYSEEFIEELGYNPEGTLYATPTTGYDNKGKTNEVEYLVINNEDGSKTFFCGNYGKNVVDNYKPTEKKAVLNTKSQATLPSNIGDVFTVTKVSGAVKAVVSLQIAPNDQNNYGSYLGTYMSEEIDVSSVASGSTFTSEEVRYFTININSGATSKTGVSGNIFNVVNSYYGKNAHNGASVKIVQFDANGNVLNITSVQIAAPHSAE